MVAYTRKIEKESMVGRRIRGKREAGHGAHTRLRISLPLSLSVSRCMRECVYEATTPMLRCGLRAFLGWRGALLLASSRTSRNERPREGVRAREKEKEGSRATRYCVRVSLARETKTKREGCERERATMDKEDRGRTVTVSSREHRLAAVYTARAGRARGVGESYEPSNALAMRTERGMAQGSRGNITPWEGERRRQAAESLSNARRDMVGVVFSLGAAVE